MLLAGHTARYKATRAGTRAIVALQIPGEAVSCSSLFFDPADHSTRALTRLSAAVIPRAAFRQVIIGRPAIGHAVLMMTLIEASIAGEWLVNVGRRAARERIAHFFCEFAARMDAAGLSDGTGYDLPLTQEQLGDAVGLTAVHVNRVLKQLGADGLIHRIGRRFAFSDRRHLERLADFTGDYLRTDRGQGRSGL